MAPKLKRAVIKHGGPSRAELAPATPVLSAVVDFMHAPLDRLKPSADAFLAAWPRHTVGHHSAPTFWRLVANGHPLLGKNPSRFRGTCLNPAGVPSSQAIAVLRVKAERATGIRPLFAKQKHSRGHTA